MFSGGQFLEILILHLIDVVNSLTIISGLRTEKEHQHELNRNEDDEDMEEPFPSKIGDDGSCDDCCPTLSDEKK